MNQRDRIIAAMARLGSQYKVAAELGLNQSTVSRYLTGARNAGMSKKPVKAVKAVATKTVLSKAAHKGLSGFRALFDPAQRGHDAVQKIVEGELKERGWIYDAEMRGLAGVDSAAWTNLRRDYNELLVEVKDPDTRTRKTVWCHPDIVAEARQVAKERAR